MYIYQNYKSKKQLNKAIKDNNLHKDYLFGFDHKLYKMLDDTYYVKVSYFEYSNNYDKKNIERLCELEYEPGDIIKITGVFPSHERFKEKIDE